MMQPQAPFLMRTPEHVIRQTVRQKVFIDDLEFLIDQPADYDQILDDPAVLNANEQQDYMPYWATIWPAARMLAKAIFRQNWRLHFACVLEEVQVLEIGCGLGLAGITALKLGFQVTFSDYDLAALDFAKRNAKLNQLSAFQLLPMDWRCPPVEPLYDLLIAADVTYEEKNIAPVLQLIQTVLKPGGFAMMTDPDRLSAPKLRELLTLSGLKWEMSFIRAGEPGGERSKGTLYWIQKPMETGHV